MTITKENYMTLANSGAIPFAKMPKDLADTHGEMPDYLEFYNDDKDIKAVVDLYLQKTNAFIYKLNNPDPIVVNPPVKIEDPIVIVDPVVEIIEPKPKVKTAGFFSSAWGKLLVVGIGASLIFGSSNVIGNESKSNKKGVR